MREVTVRLGENVERRIEALASKYSISFDAAFLKALGRGASVLETEPAPVPDEAINLAAKLAEIFGLTADDIKRETAKLFGKKDPE